MSLPILFIGNFLSASGGSRGVCEELAIRFSAKGWPVVTASEKRPRLQRLLDMLGTTWRRRRDYAVAQVDLYSGPAFLWAEAVCAMLRLVHKPYILTLHGGNLPMFAARHPERARRLLRSATAVTAPSQFLFQQMAKYRLDLQLLPNALDLGLYPFRRREQPQPRLIWLRAMHRIYNPELAPRVLALLTAEFPRAELIMIGPDKGDGSAQRAQWVARELGVGEKLSWAGGVPKAEVPVWLERGDIFLNTANVDNTPVSVLEAMACGLCVVSTNAGGLPYLLKAGEDALLVPPGDAAGMAKAVRRLLTEPGLAGRLSDHARRKAEAHDWSVVLPQWENLFGAAAASMQSAL